MKVASLRIKPLPKKASSLDVGNVSKVLEKAVHSPLVKFLDQHNISFEIQSGFRGHFSTDTCLLHLFDFIKDKMAKDLYTGMIILDLQKDFNTVDHELLCKKLKGTMYLYKKFWMVQIVFIK